MFSLTAMYLKKTIIVYDAECILCNRWIVLALGNSSDIVAARLQSPVMNRFLQLFHRGMVEDTIIVLDKNRIFYKSDAVLHIFRKMNGFWPFIFLFIALPKFIRDKLYDIIARNRYRWFGRTTSCPLPAKEISRKVIQI
jgi:predicted DCC family thiol-disulfide oxidoreductase YuxK